jgi:hypothetical protein
LSLRRLFKNQKWVDARTLDGRCQRLFPLPAFRSPR